MSWQTVPRRRSVNPLAKHVRRTSSVVAKAAAPLEHVLHPLEVLVLVLVAATAAVADCVSMEHVFHLLEAPVLAASPALLA